MDFVIPINLKLRAKCSLCGIFTFSSMRLRHRANHGTVLIKLHFFIMIIHHHSIYLLLIGYLFVSTVL